MKVGLCLYSVKNALARDPKGTMEIVAKMGFKYWETPAATPTRIDNSPSPVSPFGMPLPAKEAKALIEHYGVVITGNHYAPVDYPDFERYLEFQAELGLRFVGPSAAFFDGYDDILRKCELFNKQAALAKSYGLRYYYHNHYHEFQKYNGQYVEDIIYENTDPELVNIQLDTYWAARGGADPVELINRYSKRLVSLHQKDFPANYHESLNVFDGMVDPNQPVTMEIYQQNRHRDSFAEVGTGILDIQSYIDAGNEAGVSHIYLEQDMSKLDELDSVKVSMENFKKYSGIEWD